MVPRVTKNRKSGRKRKTARTSKKAGDEAPKRPRGRPVEYTEAVMLSFQCEKPLADRIDAWAQERGLTRTQTLQAACELLVG